MSFKNFFLAGLSFGLWPLTSYAAVSPLDFTVNTSETVVVDTTNGTPSIDLDVGGVTRQATYHSGSNSSALVFRYTPVAGDVDLDGVSLGSAINPNSGILTDASGNPMTNFTITPPSTPNVKINYPSLSMDFVADADGRYTLNGTAYDTLATFLSAAGGTFTRSSIGTYFDSSGVLQTASSNTPRFDHDPVTHAAKGILIEESRTNLITNSIMQGVVAGTPGNLPTGWSWAQTPPGITTQVVGSGVENGITYVDIRISGTPSNGQKPLLQMVYATITNGSTYTSSVYIKNITNTSSIMINMSGRDSSNLATGYGSQLTFSPSSSLARSSLTFTPADGTTTKILYWLQLSTDNGVATDQTFRIAAPQLEQGAFPTSYIPTTSAALNRAVDILNIPNGSNITTTSGTMYAESFYNNSSFRRIVGLYPSARNFLGYSGGANGLETYDEGSTGMSITFTPPASSSFYGKYALGWSDSTMTRSLVGNGGTVSLGSYTNGYNGATGISIGSNGGGSPMNESIRKFKYYPLRVSNTQLQLLTQ